MSNIVWRSVTGGSYPEPTATDRDRLHSRVGYALPTAYWDLVAGRQGHSPTPNIVRSAFGDFEMGALLPVSRSSSEVAGSIRLPTVSEAWQTLAARFPDAGFVPFAQSPDGVFAFLRWPSGGVSILFVKHGIANWDDALPVAHDVEDLLRLIEPLRMANLPLVDTPIPPTAGPAVTQELQWSPYLDGAIPPPTDEDRRLLETAIGHRLPDSYWAVVSGHQGHIAEPDHVPVGRSSISVGVFLLVVPPEKAPGTSAGYSVLSAWDGIQEFWPRGLVPFADDTGGNNCAFDFRAGGEPHVVFIDHEIEGEDGLTYLAADFNEFLGKLQLDPD